MHHRSTAENRTGFALCACWKRAEAGRTCPMAHRVLLLAVADPARTLRRLRARLPDTEWSCGKIAVPLEQHTAEEVLSLCCSLEVWVRGSRVVGSDDAHPSPSASRSLTADSR